MSKYEWITLAIFSIFVSAIIAWVLPDRRYRKALVQCGKAHYDTMTGEFVEHEEAAGE